jgi:hypothetical protein
VSATDSRRQNLKRANVVRFTRANVKAWVGTPPTREAAWARASNVVENVLPELAEMPVDALLRACAYTGHETVDGLLSFAGIRSGTPIANIRRPKRLLLCFALRAGSLGALRAAVLAGIESGGVGHLPSLPECDSQSTGIRTDVRVDSEADIRRPGGAQTPRATAQQEVPR